MSPILHPRNLVHMCIWFLYLVWSQVHSWWSSKQTLGKMRSILDGDSRCTCIITGGTSGIGLALARLLAKEKYHIIVLCRTVEGAGVCKSEIASCTPGASVEAAVVNLCVPSEVLAFTKSFKQKEADQEIPALKVLINNAGIYASKIQYDSETGLESTFAANLYGHHILTAQLLPYIIKNKGVIVFMSSFSHRAVSDTLFQAWISNLQGQNQRHSARSLQPAQAYSCSKLGMVVLSNHMRALHGRKGVHVVCFDPGAVITNITRNWPWLLKVPYTCVMSATRLLSRADQVASSMLGLILMSPGASDEYYFGTRLTAMKPSSLLNQEGIASALLSTLSQYDKKFLS